MSQQWMFPVGIFWGVMVLGLVGSGKPLTTFDLWLDRHDAPVTAQANALSPVIDCINRVDVPWRIAYERYQSPEKSAEPARDWMADKRDFSDVPFYQQDVCSAKISEKLNILDYDKPLAEMAERYVQALEQVTPLTLNISAYQKVRFSSASYASPADTAAQFQPRTEDYLRASTALRQHVESLDLEQRQAQLKLIEARLGKDIHWTLLAYMIQARDTLNLISEGVKTASLTPQALAKTTADLQRAWDARQPFIHVQFPEPERNKLPRELWWQIDEPSQRYLDALNRLHRDWQNKAEPQRLSADFYAVTRGYDSVLNHYNRLARAEY
ncbi:DUF3829 domain-containing protein [Pseudomonas sp. NPDC086278]|uniref:DUF3829 domain-containing protein n=1 Tax=Pseudomonas sp. NPDC086278 TaxID=3390646 RepID=UPI003D00E391